ncbi:MAG: archease [Candidatus Brocadiia bacterium]
MVAKYELVPHTADMGISVKAKTLKTLFTNAAFGLFDIMTDTKKVKPAKIIKVNVNASKLDELLQGWLSALHSKWALDNELLSGFSINSITKVKNSFQLSGLGKGERYDPKRHCIKTEIKAVTFHGLHIIKIKGGYEAQVIFDV